eukprot:COSAG05_NODE_4143_length_1653_cov_57.517123_1_plen_175_part_00
MSRHQAEGLWLLYNKVTPLDTGGTGFIRSDSGEVPVGSRSWRSLPERAPAPADQVIVTAAYQLSLALSLSLSLSLAFCVCVGGCILSHILNLFELMPLHALLWLILMENTAIHFVQAGNLPWVDFKFDVTELMTAEQVQEKRAQHLLLAARDGLTHTIQWLIRGGPQDMGAFSR